MGFGGLGKILIKGYGDDNYEDVICARNVAQARNNVISIKNNKTNRTDNSNIVRFRIKPEHEDMIQLLMSYHNFRTSAELMRYLIEKEHKTVDFMIEDYKNKILKGGVR